MSHSTDDVRTSTGEVSLVESPPRTPWGIARRLGPGLIIAASIVGSGELIATTKTGAEAGIYLLWLIVIGCVIKVFAQVEFGRCAITEGRGTMEVLNQVPGPRLRVNWLVWYWLFMSACSLAQLGGIVGMVGQTMSIAAPLTGDFQTKLTAQAKYDDQLSQRHASAGLPKKPADDTPAQASRRKEIAEVLSREVGGNPYDIYAWDDVYWSVLITVITSVMLVLGRYGLVQHVSTILVAGFTAVTVFNVFALQTTEKYALTWNELATGFKFQLPDSGLLTALAAFGIIGVGATELISYPYWCLDRGYARFTGPRDNSEAWAERARGWLNVMRWDVWFSMIVYTFATIAFYLLGATVLHRDGNVPSNEQVVPTLMTMYDNTFGKWAGVVFLVGAFAVLYSTFFVAIAGHARTNADGVRIFRLGANDKKAFQWWVMVFSGVLPFVSLGIYIWRKEPVTLVLLSGMAQAIMLPMLGGAALYYRYVRADRRITPGKLWDACLWVSFAGLLVAGSWGAWQQIKKLFF